MALREAVAPPARRLWPIPPPAPSLRAAVVVPARNEAARIPACLRALAQLRGVSAECYEVIVVLDGCTDATATRVAEARAASAPVPIHALEPARPCGVGRARRLGMDLACARLLEAGRPHGLIASTDADTTVAADWLAVQLSLAARGWGAIGGEVELAEEEAAALPAAVLRERRRAAAERLQALLARGAAPTATEHHHFAGASLALTAEAYRACGGVPAHAALEDEGLARELEARGIAITRSRAVRVRTSARTSARAPRGLGHDLARASWRARRSYSEREFPLERLLEAKRRSVALILPAREVAATIGAVARTAARLREVGLLDEVLVVDAASTDGTAEIAAGAGVAVALESELERGLGPARGKGDAMWRALRAVHSEIVAFADTDSDSFGEHFVRGLLGPLLCEQDVWLVKGSFARPFHTGSGVLEGGGGRVTELLARPLLNLHAPPLASFDQPLAGEVAARRELLEAMPFSAGYGVEIAMLIDAWRLVGLDALAQVDLGRRQNRHQPLRELSAMAYAVLVAAESRLLDGETAQARASGAISLPATERGAPMDERSVAIEERPPAGGEGAAARLAAALAGG